MWKIDSTLQMVAKALGFNVSGQVYKVFELIRGKQDVLKLDKYHSGH